MAFTNSPLVDYTKLSPNKSSRTGKISKITIHHMAGNLSVENCGSVFATTTRQASSNYGVGTDGRVGLYVEEKDRAWTSSNRDNDNRAVTLEVANDGGAPDWHVSDTALAKTIELCADICKRNGIARLNFTGDASGNLTMHRYFANTACPGPYLGSKFQYIADEVNKLLGTEAPVVPESEKDSGEATTLAAGTKVNLDGVKLYRSASTATVHSTKTGEFYIWSEAVISGRIRITNATTNVGVQGKVTGWVNVSDITSAGETAPAEKEENALPYLIKVAASALNVRKGPSTDTPITTTIRGGGVFTIVAEDDGWGKLKSGAGWINLSYTEKYDD